MFMTGQTRFSQSNFTYNELKAIHFLRKKGHVVFVMTAEEMKGLDKGKVHEFLEKQIDEQRLRANLSLAVTYKEPKRTIRKVNLKRKNTRLVFTLYKPKKRR